MRGRGENQFRRLPGFAAKLYDRLTRARAFEVQLREIARDLASRIDQGRLLDIGTGPGRMLLEIHRLKPDLELFGIDIADSMVRQARRNLTGIRVDLRPGSIRHTDFESDFFDLVTCTGSFYLWNYPGECLEEVFRILKQGRSAYFFETYQDFDAAEFREALRANLRQESLLRRLISPLFLKKHLKMTYQTDAVAEIVKQSSFANSYSLEKIALAGLPIWLRVKLTKNLSRKGTI